MKILGFILHAGYVESSRASVLFLRHLGTPSAPGEAEGYTTGFDTPEAGLRDLAHYFLTDFLEEEADEDPTIEDFEAYLYAQFECDATASNPILPHWWNREQWEAWDDVRSLIHVLDQFHEVTQMDTTLPYFLDPERITPAKGSRSKYLPPQTVELLKAEVRLAQSQKKLEDVLEEVQPVKDPEGDADAVKALLLQDDTNRSALAQLVGIDHKSSWREIFDSFKKEPK